MRGVAVAVLVGLAGPAAAQDLDTIRAEAGPSWELVLCSGVHRVLADVGEGDAAAADRIARLTGMGAALVRSSTFDEPADRAVAVATRHADALAAMFGDLRAADPAGFADAANLDTAGPTCARYADAVEEQMGPLDP